MLAVEKLEGRWIRRTPYGVDGNIDFDQTTIHAEHFDGPGRCCTFYIFQRLTKR
jgi:hypothetical protein